MNTITQTEQDYLNFKWMFLECREGMSHIQENNEGVSKLLKQLASSNFKDVCKLFFTLDDGVKSYMETALLKWLEGISQDTTRLGALSKAVQDNPFYDE